MSNTNAASAWHALATALHPTPLHLPPATIGKRCFAGRVRGNLSRATLGKLVGVSPQTIENWEKGKTVAPSPTIVMALADALQDIELLKLAAQIEQFMNRASRETYNAHKQAVLNRGKLPEPDLTDAEIDKQIDGLLDKPKPVEPEEIEDEDWPAEAYPPAGEDFGD